MEEDKRSDDIQVVDEVVGLGTTCQAEAIGREMEHAGGPKKKIAVELGVFSTFHSSNDYVSKIPSVTKVKENLSGREPEF